MNSGFRRSNQIVNLMNEQLGENTIKIRRMNGKSMEQECSKRKHS